MADTPELPEQRTGDGLSRRAITDADHHFLCRLYASTRTEELAPLPWSEAQKQAFLGQQFAAQSAHYQQHYVDAQRELLLLDGHPVGRLLVHRTSGDLRLMDLSLIPEARGLGIGNLLLAELMQEAHSKQRPLSLHVEKFNPARHWYQRLGFAVVDEVGAYEQMVWQPPAIEAAV